MPWAGLEAGPRKWDGLTGCRIVAAGGCTWASCRSRLRRGSGAQPGALASGRCWCAQRARHHGGVLFQQRPLLALGNQAARLSAVLGDGIPEGRGQAGSTRGGEVRRTQQRLGGASRAPCPARAGTAAR